MSPTSDACILVTIPSAILTSSLTGTLTGQLVLEYVTYDTPPTAQVTRDVLLALVLRSGNNNNKTVLFKAPLDPARALSVSSVPPPSSFGFARQRYIFHATRDDTKLTVELPKNNKNSADDINLFHSVLAGYLTDVRVNGEQKLQSSALPPSARVVEEVEAAAPVAGAGAGAGAGVGAADEDLRGRFVLMNEDDGEIVGTLDRSVKVHEDPSLEEGGHEKDTLVVEVPEGANMQDGLLKHEVLVSTIPPEDRDWMIKSAIIVSHAISGTSTRLASAMTNASNFYIAHSTPSKTSAPGGTAASPRPTTPSSSSSASQKSQGQSHGDPQAPPSRTPPSQSSTMRRNLTQIHAASDSATKLSGKAATLIQRAVGSASARSSSSTAKLSGKAATLFQRAVASGNSSASASSSADKGKGKGRSPTDTVKSPMPQPQPPPAQPLTRTRTSVGLSAALIFASIETSAVRLADAGGAAVTAAVTHKFGTAAGENVALVGRTARNIVLVYVDIRGLGRPVMVKRVAKTWVDGRIASARQEAAAEFPRTADRKSEPPPSPEPLIVF